MSWRRKIGQMLWGVLQRDKRSLILLMGRMSIVRHRVILRRTWVWSVNSNTLIVWIVITVLIGRMSHCVIHSM